MNGNTTISGSTLLSGSTTISGSTNILGTTTINGNTTITGSLTLSSSADIELNIIGNSTLLGTTNITGSLNVTGSMVYSGSVRGEVTPLVITSNTASLDCSKGNFFTLNLVSSVNTNINPSNIRPGETIVLFVSQSSPVGTVTYPSTIKFPTGFPYVASFTTGAVDIITFVSFNTSSLYAVATQNLI